MRYDVESRISGALRYVPLGAPGVAVAICSAVPTSIGFTGGGVVACSTLACPGLLFALRRRRLFSWPLVSALGFPAWAKDAGHWAFPLDRKRLKWYAKSYLQRARSTAASGVRRSSAFFSKQKWRLKEQFRCAKRCHWCKRLQSTGDGKVDTSVDTFWYCNACWQTYEKHVLCSQCNEYHSLYRMKDDGDKWTCLPCWRKTSIGIPSTSTSSTASPASSMSPSAATSSRVADSAGARTGGDASAHKAVAELGAANVATEAGTASGINCSSGGCAESSPSQVANHGTSNGHASVHSGNEGSSTVGAGQGIGKAEVARSSSSVANGSDTSSSSSSSSGTTNTSNTSPGTASSESAGAGAIDPAGWGRQKRHLEKRVVCLTRPRPKLSMAAPESEMLVKSLLGVCHGDSSSSSSTASSRPCSPQPDGSAETEESTPLRRRLDCNGLYTNGTCASVEESASRETGKMGSDTSPPTTDAHPIRRQEKSRDWQIIEQATGITFESTTESLASLDSLRRTKLAGALRRETGKRLSREALKRSACLGDLLVEIERLQPEEDHAAVGGASASATTPAPQPRTGVAGVKNEFAHWGCMWWGKCQWILRRSRPLKETVLRKALRMLMRRHEALEAELQDPYNFFQKTQMAFTAYENWRRHGHKLRVVGRASSLAKRVFGDSGHKVLSHGCRSAIRVLDSAIRWSFLKSWPRVGRSAWYDDDSLELAPLYVNERCANVQEAYSIVWMGYFYPPFKVWLTPYGKEGSADEGVLVRLAVTHMLSDGYSVVPLLNDLAHFVAQAEAEEPGAPPAKTSDTDPMHGFTVEGPPIGSNTAAPTSCSSSSAPMPAIPSMFATMDARVAATIEKQDGGITRDAIVNYARPYQPEAHSVHLHLPADVVCALRSASRNISVPEDVGMLTLIGITLAWFQAQESLAIAMIVPQRDEHAENDMVGLFADIRHLAICTGGLSLAGAALRLHHDVKERRWRVPGLATQCDIPFVNFEWTDFTETHGFSQYVHLREFTSESARHPLKVVVEQPDVQSWRMAVAFSTEKYNEADRDRFCELFHKSLFMLLDRPLSLLWPPLVAETPVPAASSSATDSHVCAEASGKSPVRTRVGTRACNGLQDKTARLWLGISNLCDDADATMHQASGGVNLI